MFDNENEMYSKYEDLIDLDEIDNLDEIDDANEIKYEEDDELEVIDLDEEVEKKSSWKRELVSTVLYLMGVVLVTFLFVQFVAQRTHVNGDSMNATLAHGDNLLVDKISYRFGDPERFDIIVFPYQYQEDTYYIKRIIGMPGETVQIVDGEIYINGELMREDYGTEIMEYAGVASEPIVLGEDEYFVLGDNRNNSSDSRDPSVGNVKGDRIIGKAFLRIWPLNKIGIFVNR